MTGHEAHDADASRFVELWNDYLEGELDELGITELGALMERDERRARTAAESLRLHRLLGWLSRAGRASRAAFVEATMTRLPASSEELVAGVMERIPLREARQNRPTEGTSAWASPNPNMKKNTGARPSQLRKMKTPLRSVPTMKNPLVASFLAIALGGAALVSSLMNRSSGPRLEAAPARSAVAGPNKDLLARIETLAEENRELRGRLSELELRPEPAQRDLVTEGFASKEELNALREEILAARTSTAEGEVPVAALDTTASREFTDRVASSLLVIRKKEAVEEARRNVESRSGRLEKVLPRIGEKLGLNYQQEKDLEKALVSMYATQANYRVMFETGEVANREDFGPIKRNDITRYLESLGTILTPVQLEQYHALGKGDWGRDLFPGVEFKRNK